MTTNGTFSTEQWWEIKSSPVKLRSTEDVMAESSGAYPFGLPHPTDRAGQRETIEWLRGLPASAVAVVSAPTGSGKTSFAAALGHADHRSVALVKTKSLQVENYGEGYTFDVLYGRGNYECVSADAMRGASANDCLYGEAMHECPDADVCPYIAAKKAAKASHKASLNYSYWLTARWPREALEERARNGKPVYLVMDEAHQLSDITLDWTSVTVTMKDRLAWDLPSFPVLHGHARVEDVGAALTWITSAERAVWRAVAPLYSKRADFAEGRKDQALSESEQKTLAAGERLQKKLEAVMEALAAHAGDWYIRSGPGTLTNGGAPMPGFVARPLTARYHFPGRFLGAWSSVMMSATIGDPATFAEELGLPAGYIYRDIPNQFTPDQRPVFALPAPAMGQRNRDDDSAQAEHARVIAEAINSVPHTWGGIIHVTRKSEAAALAQRLARHGIGGRLWTPRTTDSTDWALREWNQFKRRTRGAIAITWAWWEGYNGLDEKICIVAKTPFPNLADDYERARMAYSGTMFLQRTAWNLEQALGRTRRGRAEDYDAPGERRGLVCIADGNWTRAQKYISQSLRDAVRPW